MRVYALVGGIAAGKSTVARCLARRHGGTWIDADRIGHRVLDLQRVRRRLLDAFGPDIVGRAGSIDRRRLGARVFGHPARLRRLNAIVHPEIARRVEARLLALQRRGVRFVLLDAALFYEFELGWPVDGVLAVVAPRQVRRSRLRRRPGMSAAAAAARLASQPQLGEWIRRADVRVVNDGDRRQLDEKLEVAWRDLWRRRRPRRGRNGRGTER